MEHDTDWADREFAVHQHIDRPKKVRAIWPEEFELEEIKGGTGREVKAWIRERC
jgi:hypothetical protein